MVQAGTTYSSLTDSQKATGTVATISSMKMRAAAPAALERLLEEAAEIMLNMTVPSRSV